MENSTIALSEGEARALDEEGNEVFVANKPMQKLRVKVPVRVDSYTFIHSER